MITIGFTDADSFVTAKSYTGTLTVKDGQVLTDGENNYRGTLTTDEISAIAGQTLKRKFYDIVIADSIKHGTVTASTTSAAIGETVTLTFTPYEGYVILEAEYICQLNNENRNYSVAINGNTGTFTVPDVEFVGEEITITATFAKRLTGGTADSPAEITDNTIDTLSGGYYTVNSNITFDHTLMLTGDVTLSLSEGKTMTVNTDSNYGINGMNDNVRHSLTICGEGALTIKATNRAINEVSQYNQTGGTVNLTGGIYWGIYTLYGTVNISGGTINATGSNGDGIYADDGINISGGTVNSSGKNYGLHSGAGSTISITGGVVTAVGTNNQDIYAGNINITGGQVTAKTKGIKAINPLTLGYSNATDFIDFTLDNTTFCTVADGQILTDGTNDYSGLITADLTTALRGGKKLTPKIYTVSVSGNISASKEWAQPNDTITLSYTGTVGTGYKVVFKVNGTAIEGNTFEMPEEAVTITAEVTPIIYNITYNLNNGTVATDNPTTYTVETETFTLINPTREGYTFTGWTGTGLDSATMTVTVEKGLTGDRTYTATWKKNGGSTQEDDPTKPTFRAHALKLDGEIAAIFYMNLPQLNGVNYADSYMEFTLSRDRSNVDELRAYYADTITTSRTVGQETKTYYGFKCPVASPQMADTITATLHYGDNLTVSQDYSVVQYLDEVLEGNYTGTDKDLMLAIQDYGHYAQLMLSEANNWSIGTDHATIEAKKPDIASDVETVKSLTSSYAFQKSNNSTGIKDIGFALLLETVTSINVYFDIAEGYDVGTDGLKVTVDGTEKSAIPLHGGTQYMIQIPDIPAQDLNKAHTITGNNGGEFSITNLSALSYVNKVLNSAEESIGGVDIATMKNAVTAFYKYHKATLDYMAQ